MNSSEAAESIVKMTLEGVEVAARITGEGAKNLSVLLYTMAKDKKMTKGKIKLNDMLKSGNPLQIFSLKEEHLKKFNEEAKRYGVLYTALVDRKHKNDDGMVDLMVRAEDAPKVNRIVDRFQLSIVDIASIKSEIEKDKIAEMLKEAKEKGIEVKSDEERIAEDIMTKPIQKTKGETVNPNIAETEKSPQSKHFSKSKNKDRVVSKIKKPSVRKELNEIKEEMKYKNDKQEKNKEIKKSNNKIITNDNRNHNHKKKKAKKHEKGR